MFIDSRGTMLRAVDVDSVLLHHCGFYGLNDTTLNPTFTGPGIYIENATSTAVLLNSILVSPFVLGEFVGIAASKQPVEEGGTGLVIASNMYTNYETTDLWLLNSIRTLSLAFPVLLSPAVILVILLLLLIHVAFSLQETTNQNLLHAASAVSFSSLHFNDLRAINVDSLLTITDVVSPTTVTYTTRTLASHVGPFDFGSHALCASCCLSIHIQIPSPACCVSSSSMPRRRVHEALLSRCLHSLVVTSSPLSLFGVRIDDATTPTSLL